MTFFVNLVCSRTRECDLNSFGLLIGIITMYYYCQSRLECEAAYVEIMLQFLVHSYISVLSLVFSSKLCFEGLMS